MKNSKLKSLVIVPLLGGMMFSLYPRSAAAELNFIYKNSTDPNLVAKFQGSAISTEEVSKDIQRDLYTAQKNIYDLKINQLKSVVRDRVIKSDPRSEGLSSEAFLQKYVLKTSEPTDKDITDFILKQKIPQNQVNQQLRDRVKAFILDQQRKSAIDQWLDEATQKNPVEIYLTKPEPPKVEIPVSKDDQTKGREDAKVTIVEFSEFQCPYCSRGAATIKEVTEKYGDQVRLVFKNFPLPMHENARKAASYGLCANEQSSEKYWQLHDLMFADQAHLDEASLSGLAQKVGLDMEVLKTCIDKGTSKIDLDLADGNRAGVTSTPTFFINGIMVKGAQPASEFTSIIDKMLQK